MFWQNCFCSEMRPQSRGMIRDAVLAFWKIISKNHPREASWTLQDSYREPNSAMVFCTIVSPAWQWKNEEAKPQAGSEMYIVTQLQLHDTTWPHEVSFANRNHPFSICFLKKGWIFLVGETSQRHLETPDPSSARARTHRNTNLKEWLKKFQGFQCVTPNQKSVWCQNCTVY